MKKTILFLALFALMFSLTGCYRVFIEIQINEAGQAYFTHLVAVPRKGLERELNQMGLDQKQAEELFTALAHGDAVMIGDTHVRHAKIQNSGDYAIFTRRFVFDNLNAMRDYLSMLGLHATVKERRSFFGGKLKGYDVCIEADSLNAEKLVRFKEFFHDSNSDGEDNPFSGMFSGGNDELTMELYLPGNITAVEPEAKARWIYRSWKIDGQQFTNPFHVRMSNEFPRRDAIKTAKADAAALPTLALNPDEAANQFANLFDGNYLLFYHARILKNGKIDLNLAPLSETTTVELAEFNRLSEWFLTPEMTANYYEWMDVPLIENEPRLGFGTRSREPFAAKDVEHLLRVASNGRSATFYPPKVYADAANIVGDPQRLAMVVMVTFADGRVAQAPVYAKDLAGGASIVLKP